MHRDKERAAERLSDPLIERGCELRDHLADEASFAVTSIHESWRASDDKDASHGKALWYGFHLAVDCQEALTLTSDTQSHIGELLNSQPDLAKRYDAYAALSTIAAFAEGMETYHAALRRICMQSRSCPPGLDSFFRSFSLREPEVMKSWHLWLRPPNTLTDDHGDASIFAMAAERLSQQMTELRIAGHDSGN